MGRWAWHHLCYVVVFDVEKTTCKCHVNRMMFVHTFKNVCMGYVWRKCVCVAFVFTSALLCLHLLCKAICATCYLYQSAISIV